LPGVIHDERAPHVPLDAGLAFCMVPSAFAQSLAQKQKYAEEEKRLSEMYIKKTNEQCKR